MNNREYANSLMEIAAFYETHPEMPLPYDGVYDQLHIYTSDLETTAKAGVLLSDGGRVTKDATGSAYTLTRKFGEVEVQVWCNRQNVCKIVGYKREEVRVQRIVTPAVTEEVEESRQVPIWECPESLIRTAKLGTPTPQIEAPLAALVVENCPS